MFYDELLADPQAYLDRICDFLDCDQIRLPQNGFSRRAVNSIERPARDRRRASRAHRLIGRLRDYRAYRTIDLLEHFGVWDRAFGGGEPFAELSLEVERRVRERFRPEVTALEDLLELDLSRRKLTAAARPAQRTRAAGSAPRRSGEMSV